MKNKLLIGLVVVALFIVPILLWLLVGNRFRLVGVSPRDDGVAPLATVVEFRFSKRLQVGQDVDFRLDPSVAGNAVISDKTITFYPLVPLPEGNYTATIGHVFAESGQVFDGASVSFETRDIPEAELTEEQRMLSDKYATDSEDIIASLFPEVSKIAHTDPDFTIDYELSVPKVDEKSRLIIVIFVHPSVVFSYDPDLKLDAEEDAKSKARDYLLSQGIQLSDYEVIYR